MRYGLSLLTVMLCSGSSDLLACGCPDEDKQVSTPEKVRREFRQSDFVAEIAVDSVQFDTQSREFPCSTRKDVDGDWVEGVCHETNELLVARFRVVKLWKGESTTTTVITPRDWQACGLPFKKGDRVLLYAYADQIQPERLATDSCGRTDLVTNAKKDLKVIREMFKRTK